MQTNLQSLQPTRAESDRDQIAKFDSDRGPASVVKMSRLCSDSWTPTKSEGGAGLLAMQHLAEIPTGKDPGRCGSSGTIRVPS